MIQLRKAWATVAVVAIAFLCVALPTNAAACHHYPRVLHAHMNIAWTDPPGYWWAGLTGDINGMSIYQPDPDHENWITGNVVHFYEVFAICFGMAPTPMGCNPPTGSYVIGNDHGLYDINPNAVRWHFVATGWVTGASPDMAYLIGHRYYENGWTTSPYDPETFGVATVLLIPA